MLTISTLKSEYPKILMSRSFGIELKKETMPNINHYFVNGRMEILGVLWEIDDSVRGFRLEAQSHE